MRRRLALGGRGCRAGVRVPRSPRLLLRQITLFEQHILPRCRDPRVLILVEDNLGLGRRAGRIVLVLSRGTGVGSTVATSGSKRLVPALSEPTVETVRVIFLSLRVTVSQSLFFVLFAGWS